MSRPIKILIISLSAGSGHGQAARAIEKTVQQQFPHITCRHIDMAQFITPLLKTTTVFGYDFLVSYLPRVWKSLFRFTDSRRMIKAYRTLTDYLKKLNSFNFLNEVEAFRPDHIICTHFLPAEILTHAQKKQSHKIPITEIITDYGVHPIWIVEGVSTYVVATPEMKQQLSNEFHIDPATVHSFGIPIDPAFEHTKHATILKKTHGLPPHTPLILVLSGGGGVVNIALVLKELFSRITEPMTILAVAGNNEKLHARITHLSPPAHITYRAFGWTDQIPEFIGMANVVISKPGGLTTTECLSLGVPLIAINPIPGQEDFNIQFLSKTHRGSYARSIKDIYPLVTYYLSQEYTKKDCIQLQSAKHILEFLTNSSNLPHTRQ